jgi:hypothetical protein
MTTTIYTIQGPPLWPHHQFRIHGGRSLQMLDLRPWQVAEGTQVRIDGELVATSETTMIKRSGLECREQRWTKHGGVVDVINAGQSLRIYASVHAIGTRVEVG